MQQESNKSEDNLAHTSNKIKAFIIDSFLIYVPILYIGGYVVMDGADQFRDSLFAPFFAVTIFGVIISLFHSLKSQTPGYRAYNMKVVELKSKKSISFVRAFFRFYIMLFSMGFIIGMIIPFLRKDRRSLHDILTKTIVIKEDS